MVIALLVFLFLGFLVAVTPGVIVGFAVVATSRRLSLGARILLLLLLAAGTGALWLGVTGAAGFWRVAAMGLTFLATLASGAAFLGLEALGRRVRRYPHPQWPGWYPSAVNR
ncbi:hypothetical protein ACFCV9_02520 [Streptomyces sp. NPDC056367]|uniref:hypothetical protein n=1 Tax=Streptomyces sp. NPDC056367 TaxID=3345797 RepID=UPI0035E26283